MAPAGDGSVVASWSLSLKPGRYQVTVAGLLPDTSTGFDQHPRRRGARLRRRRALAASPLLALPRRAGPAASATDPRDPYAAMQLGPTRLRPRFGNVFAPTDALMVVATLHGAKLDAASGKAALRARFSILKDGKPVARGAEDAFTTADAIASVGPIPLAGLRARSVRRPPRRDGRGGEPDAPPGSPVRDPEALDELEEEGPCDTVSPRSGPCCSWVPPGSAPPLLTTLPRSPSGPSPARRASRTHVSS